MKRINWITLCLISVVPSLSQVLPEVGAKWTYNFKVWQENGVIKDTTYSIEALSDTIVNGQQLLKISNVKRNCYNNFHQFIHLYERRDSVFSYNIVNDRTKLLFDFNTESRQRWGDINSTNVTVDSISYLKQGDDSLKTLHVTYRFDPELFVEPYCSKIIEKIGDISFFANQRIAVDCIGENIPNGLISYKDSTYDLDESYFNQDCEVMVGLRNIKTKNTLSVFPSITSDYLTLTQAEKLEKSTVQILSVSGEILRTFAFTGNEIGISNLTNGVYYLNVSNSEINETIRFVVSR